MQSKGLSKSLLQIDGETVETVSDFIFLGSKITADGDCSHEIKRRLLLGRKVMTNLDSKFKSRDITLPTKVRLVKAMVFPVVMYGCESRLISWSCDLCSYTGLHTQKDTMLDLKLSCHQLDILNNFIFEFVFCSEV